MASAVVLLNWLNALLAIIPEGTALYQSLIGRKTLIEQIIAADREPTAEEWTQLDADTAMKEAMIDSLTAARVGG